MDIERDVRCFVGQEGRLTSMLVRRHVELWSRVSAQDATFIPPGPRSGPTQPASCPAAAAPQH